MRSSKSRSRSKGNRSRSMGNIVNRVFDSSGPEGKVRGTPQQIIDKYTQLARDAALGNDRVAAENFQQHAEHYTRMLGEAQREMEARREQQEQQQRDRQRDRHEGNDRGNQQNDNPRGQQGDGGPQQGRGGRNDQPDVIEDTMDSGPQPDLSAPGDVIDVVGNGGDSNLVETPESDAKPKPRPRTRKPRAPKKPEAADSAEAPGAEGGSNEAAE